MKRVVITVLLLSAVAFGQQSGAEQRQPGSVRTLTADVTERNLPVTYSDLYCAGYVTSELLPRDHFVAAGSETPVQLNYGEGQFLFLRGGGYTPGTRVSIVRELRDVNRFSPFPAAKGLLQRTAQPYGELGYALVLENRGTDTAVAQVEFSCEPIVPGDLVIPFVAKAPVSYRLRSTMDRFPGVSSKLSARIVASQGFDSYLGAGRKIYLNVGEKNGLKPGDYFRVVRDYSRKSMDDVDPEMFNQTFVEETQKRAPRFPNKQITEFPRRVVGEAVVLSTHSGTATAMITFTLEDIHIGDVVELEEEQSR
jgi:hypothetical protein